MISDQIQNQSPEPTVTPAPDKVLPPYTAYVGINQAARLIGKGKQQIYRDIEAGKLSWHIEGDGKKQLQIADLDRVYKLKPQGVTSDETSNQNQMLPSEQLPVTDQKAIDTAVKIAVLESELKAKDDALRRMEDEVKDLRQNRDKQLEAIKQLTLLLPAPITPQAAPEATAPAERKSFWKRLFA